MSTHTEEAGPAPVGAEGRSRADALKKWIGAGAAVLSVVSALYGKMEYSADQATRAHAAAELLQASHVQQGAGDYPAAWASLQKVAENLQSGGVLVKLFGGLSTEESQLRTAREDLAMEWLRKTPDQVQTDAVLGTLTSAVGQAKGARKADLLAHIGLAYSLKQEGEGGTGLHPDTFYKEALDLDPTNPYANTFSAASIVQTESASDAGMAEARRRFDAALSSRRSTGALRQWIRARALTSVRTWLSYPAAGAFFWQTVDAMYEAHEPLDDDALSDMRGEYVTTEKSVESFTASLGRAQSFIPIVRHIDLLRLLLEKAPRDKAHGETRGYLQICLAIALERAGKPEESLAAWRAAKAQPLDDYLLGQVSTAIQRLSGAPAKRAPARPAYRRR